MAVTRAIRSATWPAAPYKGLSYYSSADELLFAGRNDDIVRCGALLAEWKTRLLVLHGSTGCGKSSFLRAGLIPYLDGTAAGIAFARARSDEQAPVVFVRATSDPLLMLADAVYGFANSVRTLMAPDGPFDISLRDALPAEALDVAVFRQMCASNADVLLQVLESLSRLVPETLVLIIDQGEEVLTVDLTDEGEHCRRRFFDFLGEFVRASFDLRLLVALRTEYFGRFVSHARRQFRGEGINEYLLDTLSREQVEEAILHPTSNIPIGNLGVPIDHYHFSIDDAVVRTILDELVDPGMKLSAVQIVCTALYDTVRDRGEPRTVTLQDLKTVGGVEGAIERFIDQQLRSYCYDMGLSAGETDLEVRRWKTGMFALTRPQPDGTVTTDLMPEAAFRQKLGDTRLDFARATAHFASEALRLLRKVDVINAATGALVPCVGLGHDALGLVLRNWKLRTVEAGPAIADWDEAEVPGEPAVQDGIALCLSGGGFRAMLFHLGALCRLNEIGYLRRLDLVSAVSAGAVLGAHVATRWAQLQFDSSGVALNFREVVVEPIRELANETLDVASVLRSVLAITGKGGGAGPLAESLADRLFGEATLQSWPDSPRFVVSATNVQCGSLFHFSKAYLGDYQLGTVRSPRVPVATAVAASSAVPPILSPMVLEFAPSDWTGGEPLGDDRFRTAVQLTDGTVYDHFGIEPAWRRYRTILVSDAGASRSDEPDPSRSWTSQITRLVHLLTYNARMQRRRQIIDTFRSRQRSGTYWSISSRLESYASAAIAPDLVDIEGLDIIPARFAKLDATTQVRLINWGYAVCDAAMRTHMSATAVPTRLPYGGTD